jgi:hypothetical protein
MSRIPINVGNAPNDNSGDTLRVAMQSINSNFVELYANTDAVVVHPENLAANLANYTNTAVLTTLLPVSTVNNSLYLGGIVASGYQTGAGLAANVAAYLPTYTGVVNGSYIAISGDATIGGATTISGNLTVTGNLTLAGSTTFINSIAITTNDKILILANNSSTSLLTDGAGIIASSYANLIYKNSGTAWQSNVNFTPAANNLSLGNTTSVWNIYSNNINANLVVANTINPVANNLNLGNTTALWNVYSNNMWAASANIAGTVNTSNMYATTSANIAGIVQANALGLFTTLTVNASYLTIGSAFVANSLGVYTTGTVNAASVNAASFIAGSALTVNTTGLYTGSSTDSSTGTGSLIANDTTLFIGNNTINTVMTSSSLTVNSITLSTSTNAANGYSYLPNGFKLNWGWVSSTSSDGDITFTSAYTTNAYVITATSNSAVSTYSAAVISWTKTGGSIRTANTNATNVFWQAIGY